MFTNLGLSAYAQSARRSVVDGDAKIVADPEAFTTMVTALRPRHLRMVGRPCRAWNGRSKMGHLRGLQESTRASACLAALRRKEACVGRPVGVENYSLSRRRCPIVVDGMLGGDMRHNGNRLRSWSRVHTVLPSSERGKIPRARGSSSSTRVTFRNPRTRATHCGHGGWTTAMMATATPGESRRRPGQPNESWQ